MNCRFCGRGPLGGRSGPMRHMGRRLCGCCYPYLWRLGQLDECGRRRSYQRSAVVIENWLYLKDLGVSRKEAAVQMGMTDFALYKAITRWNSTTAT